MMARETVMGSGQNKISQGFAGIFTFFRTEIEKFVTKLLDFFRLFQFKQFF